MVTMKGREVAKGHVAAVGKRLQELIVRIGERPYGTAGKTFAGTDERLKKIAVNMVS